MHPRIFDQHRLTQGRRTADRWSEGTGADSLAGLALYPPPSATSSSVLWPRGVRHASIPDLLAGSEERMSKAELVALRSSEDYEDPPEGRRVAAIIHR